MPRANKRDEPDSRQMEIEWTRGKRKTWVERLMLAPFDYVNSNGTKQHVCRTGRMKHLLLVIESHARDGGPCLLRLSTIEKRMSCSRNTVTRAIAACVGRGLLKMDVSFYSEVASRFEIVWSEVAQVILDHPETTGLIDRSVSEKAGASHTKMESVGHTKLEESHTKIESTHPKIESTHPKLEEFEVDPTSTRTRAVLNHSENHARKPEIKPCSDVAEETNVATIDRPTGGWPHSIELSHLQNRESIQRLWEHAIAFHFLTADMRVPFFALAKYTARLTKSGMVRNAGAYFTAQVIAKNWLGDHEDMKAAISAISTIDGGRDCR